MRQPLCFAVALLGLIGCSSAFAQAQLGMRLERHAGIYGTGINPAHTAFAPHRWEVSLFNADAFLENSYGFLWNTSLPQALRHADRIRSVADTSAENPAPPNAILQDFFDPKRLPMHLALQSRVASPALSFRLGESYTVGLTTALRAHLSAYPIAAALAYRNVADLPRNQAFNIPATGLVGMAWGELGLHYSYRSDEGGLQFAWGLSPKLLLGYEGFFARAQSSFDFTQGFGDTVSFGSARWDYAFTTANLSDNSGGRRLRRQGTGFGLDAGASWAMPNGDDEGGYAWRLGISLIDAGWVRFKGSAQRHRIRFDTLTTLTGAEFPARDNADARLRDISQAFLGDPGASLLRRSFTIGLPTALSVQFDAQVASLLYVGAVLVQRVPLSPYSVKRPSTLALVPRFEHRWASVSVPLSLDDWRSLRAGAAVRLAWLYVGTDNLGSFFKKEKLTGSDAYIGLKINAFSLNFGKKERQARFRAERGGSSGPNRRKIRCYSF